MSNNIQGQIPGALGKLGNLVSLELSKCCIQVYLAWKNPTIPTTSWWSNIPFLPKQVQTAWPVPCRLNLGILEISCDLAWETTSSKEGFRNQCNTFRISQNWIYVRSRSYVSLLSLSVSPADSTRFPRHVQSAMGFTVLFQAVLQVCHTSPPWIWLRIILRVTSVMTSARQADRLIPSGLTAEATAQWSSAHAAQSAANGMTNIWSVINSKWLISGYWW